MKRKSFMSLCAAVAAAGLLVGCEQPGHPPPMSGTQTLRGQEMAEQTQVTIGAAPVDAGITSDGEPIRVGTGAGAGIVGPVDPGAAGAAPGVGRGMTSGEGAVRQGTEIPVPAQQPNGGFPRGAAVGGGGIIGGAGGGVQPGSVGGTTPTDPAPPPQTPDAGIGGTGTGAVGGADGIDRGSGVGVGGTGTGAVGGAGDPGAGAGTGTGGAGGTGAGGAGAGGGAGGDD